MSGRRGLRQVTPLLALVALLAGLVGGPSASIGTDSSAVGRTTAVTAIGTIAPATVGALDIRLPRHGESGRAQRAGLHDACSHPATASTRPRAWVEALAALLERAGHPERVGHVLRRGPPGSSI